MSTPPLSNNPPSPSQEQPSNPTPPTDNGNGNNNENNPSQPSTGANDNVKGSDNSGSDDGKTNLGTSSLPNP